MPPKVSGLIQIVVTDRVSGRIIATSGVELDRAWIDSNLTPLPRRDAHARSERREQRNEELIALAFGALAQDLVASAN